MGWRWRARQSQHSKSAVNWDWSPTRCTTRSSPGGCHWRPAMRTDTWRRDRRRSGKVETRARPRMDLPKSASRTLDRSRELLAPIGCCYCTQPDRWPRSLARTALLPRTLPADFGSVWATGPVAFRPIAAARKPWRGRWNCRWRFTTLRPVYTCDFRCDFWCDFAYKTRLTLPCTNVYFAKHLVDWRESHEISFEDTLLSNFS